MHGFADRPLASLLEEFAASTPAPGGGSAAACACALGAALVEMAAALEGSGEGERMRILREHALELAERELSSYAPVLEARRLPRDDPERPGRIEAALADASAAPLAIAEAASEVAELGAGLAAQAGPAIRGTRSRACCSPRPRPWPRLRSSRSTSRASRTRRNWRAPTRRLLARRRRAGPRSGRTDDGPRLGASAGRGRPPLERSPHAGAELEARRAARERPGIEPAH